MSDSGVAARLGLYRERIERALTGALPGAGAEPGELHQAMRYAVLGGGKRMRPLLVYATAEALSLEITRLDGVACAVELIHAYSLIHDDLPAMDDDQLRRGRPTCHVAFGESTAILAGDALQALAFALLAEGTDSGSAVVKLAQVQELARACGSLGMAGGQALDLTAVGQRTSASELETMHVKKTGALIRAAIRMAAVTQPALDTNTMQQLTEYGHYVGLAFQVHDDILDESASTEALGKTVGRDRVRDKPTYPAVLGLEAARLHARELVESALERLNRWDSRADLLRHLAHYAIERES